MTMPSDDEPRAAGAATPADQVDWYAVRFAYEQTPEPVASIASHFGTTPSAIAWRRRKLGWRPRGRGKMPRVNVTGPEALPTPTFAQLIGGAPSLATPEGRKDFTRRLYDAINWTYLMAEKQIFANPEAPEAMDQIKDAVEAAAHNLDKIDRIDARTERFAAAERRAEPEPWYECADPEQFRAELARRIIALCEEWESGVRPSEAGD
jgi:hypothetical protein